MQIRGTLRKLALSTVLLGSAGSLTACVVADGGYHGGGYGGYDYPPPYPANGYSYAYPGGLTLIFSSGLGLYSVYGYPDYYYYDGYFYRWHSGYWNRSRYWNRGWQRCHSSYWPRPIHHVHNNYYGRGRRPNYGWDYHDGHKDVRRSVPWDTKSGRPHQSGGDDRRDVVPWNQKGNPPREGNAPRGEPRKSVPWSGERNPRDQQRERTETREDGRKAVPWGRERKGREEEVKRPESRDDRDGQRGRQQDDAELDEDRGGRDERHSLSGRGAPGRGSEELRRRAREGTPGSSRGQPSAAQPRGPERGVAAGSQNTGRVPAARPEPRPRDAGAERVAAQAPTGRQPTERARPRPEPRESREQTADVSTPPRDDRGGPRGQSENSWRDHR